MKKGSKKPKTEAQIVAEAKQQVADIERPEPEEETQAIVEQPHPPKVHLCLFCGAPAQKNRYINMQTVYICDDHYYSETMGKVAEAMRKRQETIDAQEAQIF